MRRSSITGADLDDSVLVVPVVGIDFLTKSDVVQLILKDNHKSSFLTRCWNTIVPFMPVRLANCTGVKNVSVGEYNFSASSKRKAKV